MLLIDRCIHRNLCGKIYQIPVSKSQNQSIDGNVENPKKWKKKTKNEIKIYQNAFCCNPYIFQKCVLISKVQANNLFSLISYYIINKNEGKKF